MSEKVYLVDGSGYIFRAFYAVAPLNTKAGLPTNALFGFTRMLKKLIASAGSEHVAVVFDSGRETFRKELYPDYKANRTEAPPELQQQFPFFPEIAKALGMAVFALPGYEADDIIGTLAKKLSESGTEVVIVSADKDFMQLIGKGISIWDTMADKKIGPPEVMNKFGVRPEQVADVLALIGDSSDNIPGLTGVGPKTAAQLMEKFGSLEGILAAAELIKNDSSIRNRVKIAQTIEVETEKVLLSKKLATIVTDAPIELSREGKTYQVATLDHQHLLDLIERNNPDRSELLELINTLQFDSLLGDIVEKLPVTLADLSARGAQPLNYHTIYAEQFDGFMQQLMAQQVFAFDLETTSLDPFEAKIVGFSFCWQDSSAFYLPIAHVAGESGSLGLQSIVAGQVKPEKAIEALKPLLESEKIKKCGQNLKFDIKILSRHGICTRGITFDSMVAAYLLNPDRGSYNLTTLSEEYLGKQVIEFDHVSMGKTNFSEVEIESASVYACQDAHYVWLLFQKLNPQLQEQGLLEVFEKIEMPLVPVLADLELAGVRIDQGLLSDMSVELAHKLAELEQLIYELAGTSFNINSPKQVSDILFNRLQISTKGLKKTKTGYSSDASVLEKLAELHDLPKVMLDYRGLHKLKTTYVDALPQSISRVSGRLHTSFNQTVTATGRLSSSSPNLQNIPIASAEGARIRAAFTAAEGRVLISADYSQIELRLLAHMADDTNMRAAFEQGIDIHSQTARELLHLPESEKVTSEHRRIGKTLNFAIIYGMGAFRLSKELGIPYNMAEDYIRRYFELYSGVKEYFRLTEEKAMKEGFVSTIFGRKRLIKHIDASGRDKGFVIRAAMNAPIQGSAADIIKLAMIEIASQIRLKKYPMSLILQIHDELVLESDESFAAEARAIVVEKMEKVVDLSVAMKVESGIGLNWQVAHG